MRPDDDVPGDPVLVDPVPVDPVLVDPVPVDPVPVDPVPDEPEVACKVEPPDVLLAVPLELLAGWVERGSATATAPVASTPATATPAVTADIRRMPRRRSSHAGDGPPAGLTGISRFLPFDWPAPAPDTPAAVLHYRRCRAQCRAHSGVPLNCF